MLVSLCLLRFNYSDLSQHIRYIAQLLHLSQDTDLTMNVSPVKKAFDEHPSVKTPPLNAIDDAMRIMEYPTRSVTGASYEAINPKVLHLALTLQTSESSLDKTDQATSRHGHRSQVSSSELRGVSENVSNNERESTEVCKSPLDIKSS
jgi:hypothetical protein